MKLPKGWRETTARSNRPGTWRFEVRSAARFQEGTLRTVQLKGVNGVKLIVGKLTADDQELDQHDAGAMVPQAILFDKREWQEFRDALAWQEWHFTRLENPPRRRRVPNPHSGKLQWSEAPRTLGDLARTRVAYEGGRFLESSILSDLSQEGRDRIKEYLVRIGHPLASEPGTQVKRIAAAARELAGSKGGETTRGQGVYRSGPKKNPPPPTMRKVMDRATSEHFYEWLEKFVAERHQQEAEQDVHAALREDPSMIVRGEGWPAIRARGEWLRSERTPNPPRRLDAFKAGAEASIERLVQTETELSAAFAEVMAIVDRRQPVPEWMKDRTTALQREQLSRLDEVKTAVARHGAAIQEFSTPPSPRSEGRRENPARVKADAVRLYERFHGHAPSGYRLERVPDLSQLVTLGQALRIDYQLDPSNARGARNTPYAHQFGPGSTLLTDPTGRALVIVGNMKVSRAPRGRFGYIREASGG